MLRLVIKDFRANWFYLLLLLAVLATISAGYVLTIRSGDSVEAELYVLVVILSAMVSSKLFILTEVEADSDKLFASLPITRKQLVMAKYGSSAMMILLVFLVHLLTILLTSSDTMRTENYLMFYPEMWIISGLILFLSDAFAFPFYFKFGAAKGAIMYGGTMISLMILSVFVFGQLNRSVWFQEAVQRLMDQPPAILAVEMLAIFLLIIWGSVLISINVFKHKDL